MKIFVMFYDRFDTATTSLALKEEHVVVCHDQSERFTCLGERAKIVETGRPKGLQHNLNAAIEMLEEGEWGIFLSDDYRGAKRIQGDRFVACRVDEVLTVLRSTVREAAAGGLALVGMNSTGNAFYAKNEYSRFGLVDGRCFALKRTSFRFHPDINTIPDYYATAWHLQQYGSNLIAQHAYLDFARYTRDGGLGSVEDRLPDKLKDVRLMLELFPDIVRVKEKAGQPAGSHIVLRPRRSRM